MPRHLQHVAQCAQIEMTGLLDRRAAGLTAVSRDRRGGSGAAF